MELSEIFDRDHVIPNLRAQDKVQLLRGLARRAATDIGIGEAYILSALESRENLGSTGIGEGIAIPHARISGLQHSYALFARLERPVDYFAVDSNPVDLIFFLLTPEREDKRHITILATVTRRLRDPATVRRLRRSNGQALYDFLVNGSE